MPRRACLPLLLLTLFACRAPIEIVIDEAGVAHVYGQTDADAWYGAGYQVATDRLFQMEMLRRFAYGRLSEVLGEEGLSRDSQARIFDFPRWGQADLDATAQADPERAELISAWVAGINARIEEVRSGEAPRPFGFAAEHHDFLPEPWTEVDPYVVLKGAGFALDNTLEFEIALTFVTALYPDALEAARPLQPAYAVWGVPPEDQAGSVAARRSPAPAARQASRTLASEGLQPFDRSLLDFPRPRGSNNWALDGRSTATGLPMIAGDPHMGFDFFGAPYPLHVNSKDGRGTYDVAGFAFPGTPGIVLGHNDAVAWACTSAFGDVMDLWKVERVGDGIQLGGELRPLVRRTETILVRGEGDAVGEGSPAVEVYEEVEGLGVLVPTSLLPLPIGDYLVSWTGFTGRPARWFMELNRVTDLDDFEAAVGRMGEMNYSFLAADASGIAYRVGVDVPDRPEFSGPSAPWKAMDGDLASTLWTGAILDDERMPHGRARERGWIATANNDPFGFTQDGAVDNDPWYYGSFFAPGYRAQRIASELERLSERGEVTLEEMQALQTDLHSTMADQLLPVLDEAHAAVGSDPALAPFEGRAELEAVVALLAAWDRRMARDSAGALAFHTFARLAAEGVLADDMPLAWDFAAELKPVFLMKIATLALSGSYPDGDTVLQEGRDAIVLEAALQTGQWLQERFGSLDAEAYRWSSLKVTDFDHAYGFGLPLFEVPTDGGEDTINVAQDIRFDLDADAWRSSYVSVERTVARIGEDGRPEAWIAFPLAGPADAELEASSAPLEDYVEGRYRRLLFDREDVDAATVSSRELEAPRL